MRVVIGFLAIAVVLAAGTVSAAAAKRPVPLDARATGGCEIADSGLFGTEIGTGLDQSFVASAIDELGQSKLKAAKRYSRRLENASTEGATIAVLRSTVRWCAKHGLEDVSSTSAS